MSLADQVRMRERAKRLKQRLAGDFEPKAVVRDGVIVSSKEVGIAGQRYPLDTTNTNLQVGQTVKVVPDYDSRLACAHYKLADGGTGGSGGGQAGILSVTAGPGLQGGGTGPAVTLQVGEGPGIDVTASAVGLGGDTILLYDSGGAPVREYAADTYGLDAALADAASGDVIWLPAGTIAGDHTVAAGVLVTGMGPNSILSGDITNNGLIYSIKLTGTLTNGAGAWGFYFDTSNLWTVGSQTATDLQIGPAGDMFVNGGTDGRWALYKAPADEKIVIESDGHLRFMDGASFNGDPWWDAKRDGDLAGNGVTDDTVALQNLINTTTANGTKSATIYFPPGTYLIGGALQDVGDRNAQVLLPNVSFNDQQVVLRLVGAVPPPTYGTATAGTDMPGDYYSIIKSTLAGAAGTAACFSAGPRTVGSPTSDSNLCVVIENLIFEAPTNPTFTMIDLTGTVGTPRIRDIIIYTGTFFGVVEPTNANAYGLKLPQNYGSNYSYVQGLLVDGFYTGLQMGELATCDGIRFALCKVAVELPDAWHACTIGLMQQSGCPTGILISDISDTHRCYCDVRLYDVEHVAAPAWAVTTADLSDATNKMYGHIRWMSVATGAGWDHTFTVVGGANVHYEEVGALPEAAAHTHPSTEISDFAEAVDDRVAALLQAGDNITLTYNDAANTLTVAAAGGSGGDHVHGLFRWLADGGTTVDLPDMAEYVEQISDDGAIVDPLTYTLSADGGQVTFGSGPTAASIMTAEYVIARL